MKNATFIFLGFAALVAGLLFTLPSAAAASCGTGSITPTSQSPTETPSSPFTVTADFQATGPGFVVGQCDLGWVTTCELLVDGELTTAQCAADSQPPYCTAYASGCGVHLSAEVDAPPGTHTLTATVGITWGCCGFKPGSAEATASATWNVEVQPMPTIVDNPDGTCGVRNGADLLVVPCPNPKTRNNPDGTTTIYDDKDNDGNADSGETISTTNSLVDVDRDGIPDATEAELCARATQRDALAAVSPNAGECASSTNYIVPSRFGGANLPTQVVPGADLDGDGFPVTVTVKRQRVTIQPFTAQRVLLEPAPDLVLPVDSDDENPNVPLQSIVSVPFPVVTGYQMGQDGDRDGVPVSLTLTKTRYIYDRTAPTSLGSAPAPSDTYTLDPNDEDKNVPAQSGFGPFKIPTDAYGVDRDGDRIPGTVTVTYLDVNVDRTASTPVKLTTHTETFQVDPDDGTRGASPVNLDAHDADRDDLPDAMEPHICSQQDDNRPDDGDCPNPNDYRAPAAVPNPWRRS